MADLLARHLDPDTGRILIDGQDLKTLRLHDVRGQILLLEQTPYLFNMSIADNIRFACPEATREAVEQAGLAAGLGELIARLPQGYDTPTGERGLALSAGGLRAAMPHATLIALTHRPALAEIADYIIEIRDGQATIAQNVQSVSEA